MGGHPYILFGTGVQAQLEIVTLLKWMSSVKNDKDNWFKRHCPHNQADRDQLYQDSFSKFSSLSWVFDHENTATGRAWSIDFGVKFGRGEHATTDTETNAYGGGFSIIFDYPASHVKDEHGKFVKDEDGKRIRIAKEDREKPVPVGFTLDSDFFAQ